MKIKYLLGALALFTLPVPAIAGDLIDTRLVFIAGDDSFMHSAGDITPQSPDADFGSRPGYDTFYDALDESESGRESRTHLVLHKKSKGYFKGLTTEAAMVFELNHDRMVVGDPRSIQDDGTYLRIEQVLGEGERVEVLMMPFSSDRMRLGWLWGNTWGGDRAFLPGNSTTPGFKVTYEHPLFDVMAGAKTARLQYVTADTQEPASGQMEAFYGLFAGASAGSKAEGPRLEVQAGYFQRGNNPNGPVRGESVDSGGVSARLSYVSGLPFLDTNDTRLYSADPLKAWNDPAQWSGADLAWRVAAEVTSLGQVLEDPDTSGGTVKEKALAAALYGRVRMGQTRISVKAIHRDLPFLFFDHPGVEYMTAMSEEQGDNPEQVLAVDIEHNIPEMHLRPGISFGAQMPAHITNKVPDAGIHADQILEGRRTFVYRRANIFDDTGLLTGYILPGDQEAVMVYGARIFCDLDLAAGFALHAEVTATHDDNRVKLVRDSLGADSIRKFDDPLAIGASFMARAEF